MTHSETLIWVLVNRQRSLSQEKKDSDVLKQQTTPPDNWTTPLKMAVHNLQIMKEKLMEPAAIIYLI